MQRSGIDCGRGVHCRNPTADCESPGATDRFGPPAGEASLKTAGDRRGAEFLSKSTTGSRRYVDHDGQLPLKQRALKIAPAIEALPEQGHDFSGIRHRNVKTFGQPVLSVAVPALDAFRLVFGGRLADDERIVSPV
jgi:hypothetical protein